MINKFQQGGKLQDAIMLFVQGLALTLQADPLQVILIAQLNPEALKAAVQVYQQTQDMGQAAQTFQQSLQLKTQAAKHGAKLQYLKSLKHQCAEDEELVYFKKGGSVDCGCKKKEDGGEVKKDCGGSPIDKFKKMKSGKKITIKQQPQVNPSDTVHVKGIAYSVTNSDGSPVDNRFKPYSGKVEEEDRKKAKKGDKDALKRQLKQDLASSEKCGGKVKKKAEGGEVCPKCGKVHKAGVGCAVAKFKMRGGTL